jgi:deazaflavin-dependent oxidoreductase (nitroreductase family)
MPGQPPSSAQWRAFNSQTIQEFRTNGGKVGGPFATSTLLLLTAVGHTSGQPRLVPLTYFTIGSSVIVVGSNVGADSDPAWVLNLRANPEAHIEVGTEAYGVVARELPPAERAAAFQQVLAAAPRFADYEANTERLIPLFELTRA